MRKVNSNKLGTTVENSVFEYDDDLIIVFLDGLWYPCLQRKEVRGQTRKVQRLLYGWRNAKVCAKIDRSRAEKVAYAYVNGTSAHHADPRTFYIPASYALYLGALQGSDKDKNFLERMQRSDKSEF